MFRGTEIAIAQIEIVGKGGGGADVRFKINYVSKDGIVHGTMNHTVDAAADERLKTAAQDLIAAITTFAQRAHFEGTTPEEPLAINGIAEALRAPPDPSDDIAEQG